MTAPHPPDTLDVPPFPPLRWDEYVWVGEITLLSWAGFQTRRGWYAAVSSETPSDGKARLAVEPGDNKARTPPNDAQRQAFRHFIDNEAAVASGVLRALFERYPDEKAAYEDAYDETEEAALPEVNDPTGLRPLIGLANVHVLAVDKDGIAYIGFEFGCVWDGHGAGVMTHRGHVTAVGQADCSFTVRVAREDAERRSGPSS